MTGDDIRVAIQTATPLTNPRLSEVEWDDVAAALHAPPALDAARLAEAAERWVDEKRALDAKWRRGEPGVHVEDLRPVENAESGLAAAVDAYRAATPASGEPAATREEQP